MQILELMIFFKFVDLCEFFVNERSERKHDFRINTTSNIFTQLGVPILYENTSQ